MKTKEELLFTIEKNPFLQRRIIAPDGEESKWFNSDQIAHIYYGGRFFIAHHSDCGSIRANTVYELIDEEA